MNSDHLTPTALANFSYCPRLFYLNKQTPYGTATELTVIGNFEHDVFEKYYDFTKVEWSSKGEIPNMQSSLDERISRIFEFAINVSRVRYPQFFDIIQKNLAPLRYRLEQFELQKKKTIVNLRHKGFSFEDAINMVLPWKIEEKFKSEKYNLVGYVDAIYLTSDGLVVEDIKSHNDRLDSFIHRVEHQTQLIAYAILAEEKFGIPVKKAQIFYSQDIHYEPIKISNKMKNKVINENLDARDVWAKGMPPKLEGLDALKCQFCYRYEKCFRKKNFKLDEQELLAVGVLN